MDARYITIPGTKTHELPPLLVRSAPETALPGWHESPIVFELGGYLWLIAESRAGLTSYRSKDALTWADTGRSHSGCLIFVGIRHGEFALIVRRLHDTLALRPDPESWLDVVLLVGRSAP